VVATHARPRRGTTQRTANPVVKRQSRTPLDPDLLLLFKAIVEREDIADQDTNPQDRDEHRHRFGINIDSAALYRDPITDQGLERLSAGRNDRRPREVPPTGVTIIEHKFRDPCYRRLARGQEQNPTLFRHFWVGGDAQLAR